MLDQLVRVCRRGCLCLMRIILLLHDMCKLLLLKKKFRLFSLVTLPIASYVAIDKIKQSSFPICIKYQSMNSKVISHYVINAEPDERAIYKSNC